MKFDMEIPGSEFKENQLKVLSMALLIVKVIDDKGNTVEQFQTEKEQTIYDFQTQITSNHKVEVLLLPGQVVEFYPVVNAI